ncbi:hypothetical protein [Actinoplanes friuliensis]|jgi:hypothetical protein|uniref:Secreted protein n=1 Tax=Actinoplanes friuliensis DSM 7358 TaxID=1246995 RepID=U5VP11_9ACTN|nr:hypothetical protein [Actinoplanes friuliensis]AGZ38683.1 hypothetical protein AFR_01970 [Actinoplanes friuliensis DSM 7358]
MSLLRRVVVPIGAALAAAALIATPATAAPAPALFESAHAGFDDPEAARTLTVDLERFEGAAQVDVEYWTRSCAGDTCTTIFRTAYDQTPQRAKMSLKAASFTATVAYSETIRTCVSTADGEEAECTDAPATTGTTQVKIAWTGTGEATKSRWRDDEGRLHVTRQKTAAVSGEAFGESFPVDQGIITSLARTLIYPAAA